MDKGGVAIIFNLMMAFLATVFLVALVPGFVDIISSGISSTTGLNCASAPDYNATAGEFSSLGCIGLSLIIPFLVLATLMALVSKIFYGDRAVQNMPQVGGYQ